MKRECPSLFAALLVSLLVNVLLRSQTAYRPRAGLAAAPLCALLLAAVGWLFARCWRLACDPVLRLLFGALLVFSSVLELLRLWQLADRLYPGAITLTSVCLLAVLPVVYLRRVSALSQTARAVLCLLAAATAVMLISVLPRLRITNLQYTDLTRADFFTAAKDQLTLYPEYLLPALWPAQDKRGRHTLLRLAGYALAFDVSIHLLLELFYGAAMPLRADPMPPRGAVRCPSSTGWNGCSSSCGSWPSPSSWHSISMRWCGCWVAEARRRTVPPGWTDFLCIWAASGCFAPCCARLIWTQRCRCAVH